MKLRSAVPLLLLFSWFSVGAETLARTKPKVLMAAIGDSITAGFLSSSSAVKEFEADPASGKKDEQDGLLAPDPNSHPPHTLADWQLWLAQWLNHKSTYSFASGNQINSLFKRLKSAMAVSEPGYELVIKNFAMSGANSSDLSNQADEILEEWGSGQYQRIEYLNYLLGANDACAHWSADGTPNDEMAASIRRFFKKLSVIKQDRPIRVLVSSLPNIPLFGRPEILNFPLDDGHTCEWRFKVKDRYCVSLISWKTPEEFAARESVIQSKNRLLKLLVQELNQTYPQFNIVYSGSLFEHEIPIDRLAKDCFHPNAKGQEELAGVLWGDQPWYP